MNIFIHGAFLLAVSLNKCMSRINSEEIGKFSTINGLKLVKNPDFVIKKFKFSRDIIYGCRLTLEKV